jgi:glycosyltransferase involved in cell wall biosynthesis
VMVSEFKKLGVPLHCLGSPKNPISILRLFYFIIKSRPNLIHSALWHANIVSRIFSFLFRIPVICDLHNNSFHNGSVRNFVEILPIPKPNLFVAVTKRVKESFKNIGRVGSSRIEVILNGIDEHKFEFSPEIRNKIRNDFDICKSSFVVGAVGRLVAVKRYDILIESFLELTKSLKGEKVNLLLVGDGPEKKKLMLLCKKYGIENVVKFVGHRADVNSFYSVFDCLAITSESEGLSLVVLEALASGLPIVTTGFDGAHEAVKNGKNGFVTSFGNIHETNNGLRAIFSSIQEKKNRRKSKLDYCFFVETSANAYINLYKLVVAQQKK